jgi:nucleoside-diphosphate-sugar epimerase
VGRVFVTGLTGFTGPYVARALRDAGHEVCEPDAAAGFDLLRPDAVEAALAAARPDAVVHLAALSSVTHGDASALYAVNTVGTSNLLEAVARVAPGVRKVVLASSANVYGNAAADPIDENVPPAPVNHYACSKMAMEFIARTWFDRLPIVLARPFNYTGPGQTENFLIPKLVAHYAHRRPVLELGNIDVERDFSDVRMVADAYARLLATDDAGIVVNVCSGTGRSLRSVLRQLHDITGHEPELRVAAHLVRRAEVHRLVGSHARLRELIGELRYLDFGALLAGMVAAASAPEAR